MCVRENLRMAHVINAESRSRLSWRLVNIAPDEAELDIFDVIGDPFYGVSAKDFVQQLRDLGDVAKIRLNINSPGGYVDDALAMYDAILNHQAEVTAHIIVAASAASFVAMAAEHRDIAKNGKIFIHDAQGFGLGSAQDMRTLADLLEGESNNIASIYAERVGGTTAQWRKRMQADGIGTTYRGQEAVDIGLVDEVATAPAKNVQPHRIAAQATEAAPEAPDLAALLGGQSFAESATYKPPIPSLEGLLIKQQAKFAGAAR